MESGSPSVTGAGFARAADGFLRRGGVALLVTLVGGIGLAKSAAYYGTLLRGFDAQFYYAAGRSAAVSGDWDVTDDLPLSPWQGPFRTASGVPRRPDGGIKNVFPVGLSLVEAALLLPALALSNLAGPALPATRCSRSAGSPPASC